MKKIKLHNKLLRCEVEKHKAARYRRHLTDGDNIMRKNSASPSLLPLQPFKILPSSFKKLANLDSKQ